MAFPARCVDLNARHVIEALKSVASMRALLQHLAQIAKPGEGAPKMLVPIARMASSQCSWVDAGLHVEITGDQDTCIAVAIDLGANILELIFPRLLVAVPRSEFTRILTASPKVVAPMSVRMKKHTIVLTCDVEIIGTIAPPSFEIAEASMRQSLSPAVRRSLAPRGRSVAAAEIPGTGEVLARVALKAPRVPALKELAELDVGWDVGAYSSTVFARETKPPPAMRPPSKAPTRPPPAEGTPSTHSKASAKPSKERASKQPSARAPKTPSARPAKTPAARAPKPRVVVRKKAPSKPPRATGRKTKRPSS